MHNSACIYLAVSYWILQFTNKLPVCVTPQLHITCILQQVGNNLTSHLCALYNSRSNIEHNNLLCYHTKHKPSIQFTQLEYTSKQYLDQLQPINL